MLNKKIISTMAAGALLGLTACGGGEEADIQATSEEVISTPEVEQVEVPVVTSEPAVVQTEVEANVDVDTIENPELGEGGGVR